MKTPYRLIICDTVHGIYEEQTFLSMLSVAEFVDMYRDQSVIFDLYQGEEYICGCR